MPHRFAVSCLVTPLHAVKSEKNEKLLEKGTIRLHLVGRGSKWQKSDKVRRKRRLKRLRTAYSGLRGHEQEKDKSTVGIEPTGRDYEASGMD